MPNLLVNDNAGTLRFGIRTPGQLTGRCSEVAATEFMIENILPRQSLSLVIGDSGIGKSPFMYQAATAVAAGLPFLGNSTRQGRVLYLDCENGISQVDEIVGQVSRFLDVPPPRDLLLWNLNDSDSVTLDELIGEAEPTWVIIDPLKAFFQSIEQKRRRDKSLPAASTPDASPQVFDHGNTSHQETLLTGDMGRATKVLPRRDGMAGVVLSSERSSGAN